MRDRTPNAAALSGLALSLILLAVAASAPLRAQESGDERSRPEGHLHEGAPNRRLPAAAGPGAPVRISDVHAGSLLLATEVGGVYLPAPVVDTDVVLRVSGPIVRAEVHQRFYNPTSEWVEGVYVFPLPELAAVDGLRIKVGTRVIEGEIKEREEAARVYQQARRQGRRAGLVEQERPNLFTTSVANLGPDEVVEVVLRYQEELRWDAGRFSLRFPMVAAPRYVPPHTLVPRQDSSPTGIVNAALTSAGPAGPSGPAGPDAGRPTAVPAALDACRIATPIARPEDGPVNPVSLRVELDAGFPVERLGSPSHALDVTRGPGRTLRITLAHDPVPADRDFVLEWAPKVGREPGATLFTEDVGGERYALLMVMPPSGPAGPPLPRETVFVVDTSGSMEGDSIAQAKAALLTALDRLRPEDRFNVIRFSDRAEPLFGASLPAGPGALDEARRFVQGLTADGGTEMLPAIRLALAGPETSGVVRQVIFITDGEVADEDELFHEIVDRLGSSRMFTVGIGSAPNAHFMRRAAEAGRGTFTYIGKVSEVGQQMGELFAKLESPVLTGLDVTWSDPGADAWPARVPDLYRGEPIVVAARLPGGAGGTVDIRGMRGGQPWSAEERLDGGESRPGVARLWARRKIAALMDQGVEGAPLDQVRAQVVQVALAHHLVSKFTSLVAVDVTPAAPPGTVPQTRKLPVNLPAGWSEPEVDGSLPQGGTPARLLLLLGLAALAGAVLLGATGRGS